MIGQQLLHYRIVEKLGEGGMGVVYKARDTHLDRFVAIKVLPPGKVADATRKARFVQEAKAASALNHPNIIVVHDISFDSGHDFIAMEYVAGNTLDQLIPRKGMRLNDALKIAVQVADALARAHSAGIVHRDLKPSNLIVDGHGVAKILDFGLAKLDGSEGLAQDDATRTLAARTEDGVIVGTAAYMSPEQAEGKKVDARSDIFSFGAVLYEMITGCRAFQGDSRASTLAAVLERDPKPASEVSPSVPRELEKIIARCLRKDVGKRAPHMADLAIALEEIREESESGTLAAATPTASVKTAHTKWLYLAASLAVALAAVAVWYWPRTQTRPAEEAALVPVPLTAYPGVEYSPTFSPDGSQVAFAWIPERQKSGIYVKVVGSEPPLRITSVDTESGDPAWSPDGRTIAFLRRMPGGRALVTISPLGGGERVLGVRATSRPSWTPNSRRIVFTSAENRGLATILASGGEPRWLTRPPGLENDSWGTVSPDGRTLAFLRFPAIFETKLMTVALDDEYQAQGEPRLVADLGYASRLCWIPNGSGLLYSAEVGGQYTAALFRLELASPNRSQRLATLGDHARDAAFARGSARLAYSSELADTDIFEMDLSGKTKRSPISSTLREANPKFSADGARVVFVSVRSGNQQIWVCAPTGEACSQITSFAGEVPRTPRWSPDGRTIVFALQDKRGKRDIYSIESSGANPRRMTAVSGPAEGPSFSTDGKWVNFRAADRNGKTQVFRVAAAPSPELAEPVQITREGGQTVFESSDGKEIFYTRGVTNDAELFRMALDDPAKTERKIADHVLYEAFHPSKTGIFYVAGTERERALYFYDLVTTRTRKIGDIDSQVDYGLAVSPDGKTILFSKFVSAGSDLMLVENFR